MSEEQQVIAGDLVYCDRVGGDKVGGDKITVGDVGGSYNAIGAGAQVIVTQIQQALSAVEEMEKGIQAAERRLAAAIAQKISRYARLTAPAQVDTRENPYKALLDYKLEDAPFFYGRSQAIQAMWQRMGNGRVTILESESGSGKTSLLQAGLASRLLADGHFPLCLRPYRQAPDQFIKRAFLPDYAAQPELPRFRDDRMSLKGFLERVAYYLGERQIYLFLDQFEEFFTEQSPEMRQAFAGQLEECVESDLPVRWVLSLRKEYLSDLRVFAGLRRFDNGYFLPTFRLEEAQEVVTEPVALKEVQYEAGLVDHILSDLRQEDKGIPPAQVQLVCYTLFDELPTAEDGTLISQALYNKPRGRGAGEPGAKGILTSHLTRVLDRELKGAERRITNRVLEELVTSDSRRAVRSREQLLAELDAADSTKLDHVLTALHENRLVRRDLDENDQPRYELTHDYLLSEIELDPETQARKAAQELLARELAAYRQFGALLSKDRFDIIHSQIAYLKVDETAQTLLQESETTLEAERLRELEQERALAEAQRQRAEEAEQAATKQKRLSRIAFAVGGVALILFILAAMAGFAARNSAKSAAAREAEAIAQAKIAQSQGLASSSLAAWEQDSMRGLLLAIAAGETAETPLAYDALREAVARNGRLFNDFTHEAPIDGASWNGAESENLTWSDDGTARLWDAATGAEQQRFTHESRVSGTSWNGAESQILTWDGGRTVRLWDAATGAERLRFTHEDSVGSASWNEAASEILTWSRDNTARL